ncbi:pollen-specific leucine-rich repeat extensin-like protein 3 [Cornus florida]|uniref:pollen-specific leucine-rich repeat extensin-like protein 3 n=1 Tax=Cornus florida TaxID=4283 RepID=UPI00289D5559|nr:pollen-specific leucine-rich repeat extensin-like protein 3 [Cornus florida]XP_059637364.1 pollen-specific leucine-rich repeat extensin-like protein 3 [Cornus florida]
MPINTESTPPPLIGKIGPYTVFVTPPATPKPSEPVHVSPKKAADPPPSPPVQPRTPPVQPPPQQFYKPTAVRSPSDASKFGFFWNAVAKVQNAHSSLDEHVAHWFGLNQSKYQWALDGYYESKGMDPLNAKVEDKSSNV